MIVQLTIPSNKSWGKKAPPHFFSFIGKSRRIYEPRSDIFPATTTTTIVLAQYKKSIQRLDPAQPWYSRFQESQILFQLFQYFEKMARWETKLFNDGRLTGPDISERFVLVSG